MSAAKIPPYQRVAAEIRRRITAGELAPGDRVPSTRQVAREWDVALATAAKALTALREEGLVRAEPRVGTVVVEGGGSTGVRGLAETRGSAEGQGSAAVRGSAEAYGPVGVRGRAEARGPAGAGRPAKMRGAAEASGPAEARRRSAAPRTPPTPAPEREPTREPTHAPARELTRERIVRTAIEVADSEGLAAVSMRSIAARLNAATMSPYRHVHSKDELVLLMADAAFSELRLPKPAPAHWRTRLELGARSLWALHQAHPWLAQIGPLTRPLLLPHLMAYSEWMLAALDGQGLPPATMIDLNVLLYSQVQGIAAELEREAQAASATGLSDAQWLAHQEPALAALTDSGDYPTFNRVMESLGTSGYDLDLSRLFELGLGSVLDGVAVLIEGRAG
ncbi:GntR family transcriptional regulator [Streptomyces sp. HSW2009]|uniref:TetR/AcrR family transcriptional regulator C-terminal domain-containing protein n=1 Tax=Streptomyces sp. HSW2009 TaxID=3142890 RepID=UPI0032EECA95